MGKWELREKKKALREEKRDARKRRMEYKLANFVSHRVPPGFDWEKELSWVRVALICAVVFGSFVFLIRLGVSISDLYEQKWEPAANGGYVSAGIGLKEDAVINEVRALLEWTRVGYTLTGVLLVMMVVMSLTHYGMYLLFTPKGCLPNGHGLNFWLWMIGGGL